MKNICTLLSCLMLISACSKNDEQSGNTDSPARYQDEIFTNVTTNINIKYGQALNYNRTGQEDLFLDLYQPDGDTATRRALVIGVHGGAFITGDKQAANWPEVCKAMARRGYVAASVNYRLGRNANEEYEPAWRAQQDLRAAIRFARANAASIRINPDKIYIMGSSAGGATCLITTYMDANEAPTSVNQTIWGPIEETVAPRLQFCRGRHGESLGWSGGYPGYYRACSGGTDP